MGKGSQPNRPAVRRPVGRAIKWSSEAIDALAQVSEADIEEAAEYWRANAPARFKTLLDSKPTKAR